MRLTDEQQPLWRPSDGYRPIDGKLAGYRSKRDRNKHLAIMQSTKWYALWVSNFNRRRWHTFTPPSGADLCPGPSPTGNYALIKAINEFRTQAQ